MRNALALAVALLVVFAAAPAMAEDGHVSNATLSALGLGGLEVMSDADGMQVRGLSSMAAAAGTSLVFGQLVYDDGKNSGFIVASDVNTSGAMADDSGAMSQSLAETEQGSAATADLWIQNGAGTLFMGSFIGLAGDVVDSDAGFASAIASNP